MKVVVKYNGKSYDELNEILLFLKCEGYYDFIVFSEIDISGSCVLDSDIFKNEARVAFINTKTSVSTYDALNSIKGSLGEGFLIVYSLEIEKFDINDVYNYHKSSTNLATLLSTEKQMVGIFFEPEVFDYMTEPRHFEREILKSIFEDHEATIYNLVPTK